MDKNNGNGSGSLSGQGQVQGQPKSTKVWEEFMYGWGAGLFNVTFTFPLHKLMFRQMLHNIPTSTAFYQIKSEGLSLLFRGLLPPLCQKTITTSLMFGSYHYYSNLFISEWPRLDKQLAKSAGAGLAGVTEAILTPLERLQTILQDSRHLKLHNTGAAVRHIWTRYGLLEFYRGYSAVVFRNAATNVVFFSCKEKAQRVLPPPKNMGTKYLLDFLSGGVLGAVLSSMFYPMNVVKTRMQCSLGGRFESFRVVFKIVYNERDRKWSNIYRGVHLNLIRSLISWGLINASYELFKSIIEGYHARKYNEQTSNSNNSSGRTSRS